MGVQRYKACTSLSCRLATEGCACSDGEGSVADECGTCIIDKSFGTFPY